MRDFGRACESAACDYLKKKGYKIRERNYTVKGGEIDIVAEKDGFLVFVEVKGKSAGYDMRAFGRPSDAVNAAKRVHLRYAASDYMRKKLPGRGLIPRMDVIEILVHELDGFEGLEITHLENAF